MDIYLDTGVVEEVSLAAKSRILDGVTTNPSLLAKAGGDYRSNLKQIFVILGEYSSKFTVSIEVNSTDDVEKILVEAREISKIDPNVLVKIPLTREGLEAVSVLSQENIKCNVTLCFSSNQALLAAKAGAWCVSPFIGRVNDEGYDGYNLIREIREMYDKYNFKTRILAASIRSTYDVKIASEIGVDICTIPYSIFEKLYYNPLTDIGIEKFKKDWNNFNST